MSKEKKISYIASGVISLIFIAMLTAPEISHYFKNQGLPSESDLKQSAIKKFEEYRTNPGDNDSQRTTFAETGSTKFPYSMDYKYFATQSENDEKFYIYSQEKEDWILISNTKR